jgi:hypothetical protein
LLTLASKWVHHRFGCLSLTLEMPFKDNANLPDGLFGWSASRSKRLGEATLQALLAARRRLIDRNIPFKPFCNNCPDSLNENHRNRHRLRRPGVRGLHGRDGQRRAVPGP